MWCPEVGVSVPLFVPLWGWIAVLAVIVVMLAVDLFAHRHAHVVGVREAAAWSAVWIALGLGFGVLVWALYGGRAGGEYFAGYLIEKSLAVDNVFVFALIFTAFAVPREYQHRVLFFGVLGALVFRAIFIAGGAALLERFHWILYVFGVFLVLTGWRMFRHRHDESDPTRNPVLRLIRKIVPSTDTYHGQKFWIRDTARRGRWNRRGRWVATPLFAVLVVVETTDIVFAVDSIPAIFAVTQEPFLVFTSNAFAILGLRALYFLLADLMHRFVHLKAGLSAILVFVGAKMLLLDVYKIPIAVSLAVIATCLTIAVVASLRATRTTQAVLSDAAHTTHAPDQVDGVDGMDGVDGVDRTVDGAAPTTIDEARR